MLDLEILQDWPQEVATRWVAMLRPGLRMCVPTGDTPNPVYRRMQSGFEGTTIFVLDEYGGLPAGHPARCDSMIETHLLARLDRRPQVYSLDPAAGDSSAECARYDALVEDGGIDLAILGLGSNGHVGLNEPGSAVDSVTRVVPLTDETRHSARRYGADPPPTWGMTLGLAPLLRAREIWLLVTGAHKADILSRVLDGPIGADVPASFLRRHPNAVVLADEAAAPPHSE